MGAAAGPALYWSIALTAASTAAAGYSAYASGRAASQAGRRQEELSKIAAASVQEQGEKEAARIRNEGAQLAARQRTLFATSGISVGSPTAIDILSDTAGLSELDALTASNNAAREAWGIRSGGLNANWEGKQKKKLGSYGAGSTLLSGAGQAIGMYNSAKK